MALCIVRSNKVIVRNFYIHNIRVTKPDEEAIGIRVMTPAKEVALIGNVIEDLGVDWSAGCTSASKRNSAGIKITSHERAEHTPVQDTSKVESVYVANNKLRRLHLGHVADVVHGLEAPVRAQGGEGFR